MITILVLLSLVLTARRRRPGSQRGDDPGRSRGRDRAALLAGLAVLVLRRPQTESPEHAQHHDWRMPPLDEPPAEPRPGLTALRGYFVIAVVVVMARSALNS